MLGIFSIFAGPLGWIMSLIYKLVGSYFLTILVFTVLVRLCMFPLSINQQKTQAQRAKLTPRLERLQRKYGNDKQKLLEKQQELYQKEGIKMTAGCLPSIVQMLVLMSVIAVIYKPLTYLQNVPAEAIDAGINAIVEIKTEDEKPLVNEAQAKSDYYKELVLLKHAEDYPAEVKKAMTDAKVENVDQIYNTLVEVKKEFKMFGLSLLDTPWTGSFTGINWLWLVAILSGLTSFGTSLVSMHFMKSTTEQQAMGGCSPNTMMLMMPFMSLFISFGVPAGVGLYWILSNLLAMVQTTVLNMMYNPVKIREQAQKEYEERRRRKAEDKKRLAEARAREEKQLKEEQEAAAAEKQTKKQKNHLPSDVTSADAGKDEQ